jgi:hypothetical protein
VKRLLVIFFSYYAIQSFAFPSTFQSNLIKLSGRTPLLNGPNCWNSVLYLHGFVKTLRFSSEDELNYWLTGPFCRKLAPFELVQFSDVSRIRTQEQDIHSMIFLDPELSFSKNTSLAGDAYDSLRSSLVHSMYRLEKNCLTSECTRWVEYYRCNYSKASDRDHDKPIYVYLRSHLDQIEQDLESFLFSKPADIEMARSYGRLLQSEVVQIQDYLKSDGQKLSTQNQQLFKIETRSLLTQARILMNSRSHSSL